MNLMSELTNGKRTTSPVLVLVWVTMPLTYASPTEASRFVIVTGSASMGSNAAGPNTPRRAPASHPGSEQEQMTPLPPGSGSITWSQQWQQTRFRQLYVRTGAERQGPGAGAQECHGELNQGR